MAWVNQGLSVQFQSLSFPCYHPGRERDTRRSQALTRALSPAGRLRCQAGEATAHLMPSGREPTRHWQRGPAAAKSGSCAAPQPASTCTLVWCSSRALRGSPSIGKPQDFGPPVHVCSPQRSRAAREGSCSRGWKGGLRSPVKKEPAGTATTGASVRLLPHCNAPLP